MKIQFIIRGTSSDRETKIYSRFQIPEKGQVRVWTGFFTSPDNWSDSKQRCIPRDPFLKNINSSLDLISSELIREIATTQEVVDKVFCEKVIQNMFNRTVETDTSTLVGLQLKITKEAPTKVLFGKIGLTGSSVMRYKTFLGVLRSYDEYLGHEAKLNDLNKSWVDMFIFWMLNVKKYSENYAGRNVSRLRQLANEAVERGIKVHQYACVLKSFNQSPEQRIIHTLDKDEIDKLKNALDLPHFLHNTRKWLLIAIQTGNRVSDLLNLTPENFRVNKNGIMIADVFQKKTKTHVAIPIIDPLVKDIINVDFPHKISDQKFNSYLKELGKRVGIDEKVKGNKRVDNEYQTIEAPKYRFLSSHVARRTFATLAVERGIPIDRIMSITGHKNMDMFLKYVNKNKDKDYLAMEYLRYWDNGK